MTLIVYHKEKKLANSQKQSNWAAFGKWLRAAWRPKAWARNIVFIVLLMLDASNLFRFVYTGMTAHTRVEQMVLPFGIPIPMSVGVFDATAYALIVTPTIYFLSDLVAQRKAHSEPNGLYWTALISGSLLSGLANGGALYLDFNDLTLLQFIGDKTWIPIVLGVTVMLGLLFYASMEGWDLTRKIKAKRAEQDAKLAEVQDAARRWVSTPNKYKEKMLSEGRAPLASRPAFRSLIPDTQTDEMGIPRVPSNRVKTKTK